VVEIWRLGGFEDFVSEYERSLDGVRQALDNCTGGVSVMYRLQHGLQLIMRV